MLNFVTSVTDVSSYEVLKQKMDRSRQNIMTESSKISLCDHK